MIGFLPSFPRAAQVLLLALLLAPAASVFAASPPADLLGDWVLNNERTHELQPKQKGGLGGVSMAPSISVGGMPIPLPGASAAPTTGPASDPQVMRCARMNIAMQTAHVLLSYEGVGSEIMKAGNDQGRKSRWSRKKITQTYETNSRKVSKTFELQDDGSLLVRVKLNPSKAKSVTHVRVFERPAPSLPVD